MNDSEFRKIELKLQENLPFLSLEQLGVLEAAVYVEIKERINAVPDDTPIGSK